MRKRITPKEMTLCALFTVLTAVGAFLKIPVPVVPFTLQFLFTMMAGLLLGGKLGACSVGLYALLGLMGLPVFAEGGGFWYILKPSFGYIIGFIIGSYATGRITERLQRPTLLAVPGDLFLCFLAAGLAKRLRPAVAYLT